MTPLEEFDAAVEGITNRRGAVYAHPVENFSRIMALWAVIEECPDPLIRHALCMIAIKIARLIETPDHIDSLVDAAGYARCAAMIIDRRAAEGLVAAQAR